MSCEFQEQHSKTLWQFLELFLKDLLCLGPKTKCRGMIFLTLGEID